MVKLKPMVGTPEQQREVLVENRLRVRIAVSEGRLYLDEAASIRKNLRAIGQAVSLHRETKQPEKRIGF